MKRYRSKKQISPLVGNEVIVMNFEYNNDGLYIWYSMVEDQCYYGTTWKELVSFTSALVSFTVKPIIYTHELGKKFELMKYYFSVNGIPFVKSNNNCKVKEMLNFKTKEGIEFRDARPIIGENIIEQDEVDSILDYKRLSEYEDKVRALAKVVQFEASEAKDRLVKNIPVTATSKVRKKLHNCFFPLGSENSWTRWEHDQSIRKISLDREEYLQCKRGYRGGFVEGNYFSLGKKIKNVDSYDLTSAYISVMLSKKFPMNKAKFIKEVNDTTQFMRYLETYCCLFDVTFWGLEALTDGVYYIDGKEIENGNKIDGKLASAKEVSMSLTDIDFRIIAKTYKWDKIKVSNLRVYKADYLPKELIKGVLELYQEKTKLKGIKGKEDEYQARKRELNAVYGMIATDPIRAVIKYDNESKQFFVDKGSLDKQLKEYNQRPFNRFTCYQWAPFITAYVRQIIWEGILELGDDFLYTDTDSLKCINADKHLEFIDRYNKKIDNQISKVLERYGIDKSSHKPTNSEGNVKILGTWEHDGHYKEFIATSSKQYIVKYDDDTLEATCSGKNKSKVTEFYAAAGMDSFGKVQVPAKYCGRRHTSVWVLGDDAIVRTIQSTGEAEEEAMMTVRDSIINGIALGIRKGKPHEYNNI